MGPIKCLFIDAMGVLYQAGDDVSEVLIPFCRRNGSEISDKEILDLYVARSLGRMTALDFWKKTGLEGDRDADYVQNYVLNEGVAEGLRDLDREGYRLYCLSNDVAKWSSLLRKRFNLEGYFDGWIISGEIGIRKPDPRIFGFALKKTGFKPGECLFIDDRFLNLAQAKKMGIPVLKFGKPDVGEKHGYPFVESFAGLLHGVQEENE